jgi:bleomycin hydrolase
MKKLIACLLTTVFILSASMSFGQDENKSKGIFVEPKNEFYDEILKTIGEFKKQEKTVDKTFKMDFTGVNLPNSLDEFKSYWHNPPISQGETGTCWDFSTTSFFESEVYRIHKKQLKFSEMYTDYWEYAEKAKRFIEERGNSAFGEGSEANAVQKIWKKYGVVPEEAYTGMKPGQIFHDHSKMYAEMNDYLQNIKNSNSWNEEEAISTIKSIMNHYMGVPPEKFTVEGIEYTPKEYFEKVVDLNMDDYVDIFSLLEKPYWQKVEYTVEDNWWHNKDYYNVPLDEWLNAIKKAVRNGYTMAIGGDVSEPGYESHVQAAMIPTFDIPSAYIDENAREFRFSNHTTTDDHGIHLVGYENKDGKDWFLIKDSGSGSRNAKNKGYYFYHEDYVKLKMMDFLIHKDAVKDLLSKFKD